MTVSKFYQIGWIVWIAHAAIVFLISMQSEVIQETVKKPIIIRTSIEKKQIPNHQAVSLKEGKKKKIAKETKKLKHQSQESDHLLQQIADSLEIIAPATKTSRRSELSVPKNIEIIRTRELHCEPRYEAALLRILQNHLELPEFGKVIAKIEIDDKGSIISSEILEAHSRENSEFLKKQLQNLTLPCFNEFGITTPRLDFTITFYNRPNAENN